MADLRRAMEKYGIPSHDLYEMPSSPLTFPDGAHYRLEISGVERLSSMEAIVEEMNKRNVPVHRLIITVMGSTLLPMDELKAMARLAHDAKLEVIVTPGPRSGWDIGAKQQASFEGKVSGGRLRGSDNLYAMISDYFRVAEAGFRGFLVWDEGLLWLLNQMRENGEFPKDSVFKASVYTGHGNAAGAKVLEMLGANTFNPLGDLTRPMLASIRSAVKIPMDVYAYVFDSFGGMNRFWEAAEIARISAPCYFKLEPGENDFGLYQPWVSPDFHAFWCREKVRYCEIMMELIGRTNQELRTSKVGVADLAIPRP
ncbi:MAG: hypothetical protein M1358_19830 [Chloroflexi bacterium]|nr:hypothetical protein [Chloroflexota bacterium]